MALCVMRAVECKLQPIVLSLLLHVLFVVYVDLRLTQPWTVSVSKKVLQKQISRPKWIEN